MIPAPFLPQLDRVREMQAQHDARMAAILATAGPGVILDPVPPPAGRLILSIERTDGAE